jgi:hypothetical protein
MYISAFFTDEAIPKTGLSPTVTILRISDDTVVVNAQTMTEMNLAGYYYYDFSAYDSAEKYVITADGGATLDDLERYKHGATECANVDFILSDVARLLGLGQENVYIDTTVFDSDGNLESARLRTYSVAGSVGTDNDVLATYTITAVGTGANRFSSWQQVKV